MFWCLDSSRRERGIFCQNLDLQLHTWYACRACDYKHAANHSPSTAPPLPPGVGPGVSGALACLLSSCPPQSVLLPPKSIAAAETIFPSFPPLPQLLEVSQDPWRVRLFFWTFKKIVQFLKPQSFDLGNEFEGGGRGKRKGFFSFWNLVLWQGHNSHVN